MTPVIGTTCAERVEAEYFDQDDGTCWQCGGEGWVEDPFWAAFRLEKTEPREWVKCDICGGSGRAP